MESRKVKVIDEHGIDRVANIICKFTFDNNAYSLYSIERDMDNDNLFVSTLTYNNDGTSNLVNIENNIEKSMISEVVKELITHAINDQNNKMTNVVLSNGKNVVISSVLFNKEQNINVTKTYVTTVKKAVTSVAENYYKVEEETKREEVSSIFEAMKDDVFAPATNVPLNNMVVEEPSIPLPSVTVPNVNIVKPDGPLMNENTSSVNMFEQNTSVMEPKPVLPSMPVYHEPVNEPVLPSQPEIKAEPVLVSQPVNVLPVTEEPKLFFDGSKETNLNKALGEISQEKTLQTESDGVQALRQFGSNEPVIVPQEMSMVQEPVKVLTKSNKGFASNKFFMIISILFFVAACIFLGYEAFQFFKING